MEKFPLVCLKASLIDQSNFIDFICYKFSCKTWKHNNGRPHATIFCAGVDQEKKGQCMVSTLCSIDFNFSGWVCH